MPNGSVQGEDRKGTSSSRSESGINSSSWSSSPGGVCSTVQTFRADVFFFDDARRVPARDP